MAGVEDRIYTMDGGEMKPLSSRAFELEKDLQVLIAEHPELLAWEQMQPGKAVRWILVKREMGIAKEAGASDWWAVDHLFIDHEAVPTLVEVKRGNNPQVRREVVGQMLEYAAYASQTWTAGHLREAFEGSPDSNAELELRRLLELEDSEPGQFEEEIEKFWERVGERLEGRHLRLLFVADEVPDELTRIVEFLNAVTVSHVEVLAVEIKKYEGESGLQTLVPRAVGRTAKRTGARSTHSGEKTKIVIWRWLARIVRKEEDGTKVGMSPSKVADRVRTDFESRGVVVGTTPASVSSHLSYARKGTHGIPPELREEILAITKRE